jgi:hypothetical protein
MSRRSAKTNLKRQLFSSMMGELVQSIKDSAPIQQVKEAIEQQSTNYQEPDEYVSNKPSSLEQAKEWIDAMQGKNSTELATAVSSRSPWFGSPEKRLTGLSAPSLFIPLDATALAEKHDPFSMQYYMQRVNQQSEVIQQQLQRKLDRLTGVRSKVDIWETKFPEDE